MAGVGGGSPTPALTPIGRGHREPALAATGVLLAILAFVAISLVGRSGGGPGSQAAFSGPTESGKVAAAASSTTAGTPEVRPSVTATPEPRSTPSATTQPSPGTPPPRVDVSVGAVRACPSGSTPDVPGPVDQARPPTGLISIAFDRDSHRIVLLARRGENGPVETWTFDVCTNIWERMHPATAPDQAMLGMLAYDAAAHRTIAVTGGSAYTAWPYDLASDTWTRAAATPEVDGPVRLVYDPIGGGVVVLRLSSPRLLLRYDARADAWQPLTNHEYPIDNDNEFHILLAYDASVDRLVGYHLGDVRLFDFRTGTWSAPGSTSPLFWYGGYFSTGGEIAYDESARRTILFSDGIVVAYDAAADRWETLYGTPSPGALDECVTRPECLRNHGMVYDPVNERLVVYGGYLRTPSDPWWADSKDVLAFDTRTREWTVLLEASDRQTAPP